MSDLLQDAIGSAEGRRYARWFADRMDAMWLLRKAHNERRNTMTTPDLIERLRTRPTGDPYLHMLVHEAADELERLRAQVAKLPTGWRVADDVTMAHLRWAAHVMGGIEPANHDAKLHSQALNDLRRALHRMDNCPMPPAEHLWPAARGDDLRATRRAIVRAAADLAQERQP